MFPSASNDAAKKTPTASRSFARRTMPTPRRATTAHSITIKLNLRRTGSEKNEYRPENHWNVRYQSQPSPTMTKHESIHHGLDRTLAWFSIACTPSLFPKATEQGLVLDLHPFSNAYASGPGNASGRYSAHRSGSGRLRKKFSAPIRFDPGIETTSGCESRRNHGADWGTACGEAPLLRCSRAVIAAAARQATAGNNRLTLCHKRSKSIGVPSQ